MSDKFTLNIHLNIEKNNPIIKKSFDLLSDYILKEHSHQNILSAIEQITPILQIIMNSHNNEDNFLDSQEFKNLISKIKFFNNHPVAQNFIDIIEKDNVSYYQIYKNTEEEFLNNNQEHDFKLAKHYNDFYQSLKINLKNQNFDDIKQSWNDNCDFFSVDKITFNELNEKLISPISTKLKNNYLKTIKLAQENIAELLWNYFLECPEIYHSNHKSIPSFFYFINWLEKPNEKLPQFVKLLEQKHWNALSFASKIDGFSLLLEKIFIKSEEDSLDNFDPFSNSSPEYSFINLDIISHFNQNNINIDIVFKNNTLGLHQYLREYLYSEIDKLEKKGHKHSLSEFHELDKLLTIYEKQKLESIFVIKNIKSKQSKI